MKARVPTVVIGLCLLAGCGDSHGSFDATVGDGDSVLTDAALVDSAAVIDAPQCPGFDDYSMADGCATDACGVLDSHGDIGCVDGNAWYDRNAPTVDGWAGPVPAPCGGPTSWVGIAFVAGKGAFQEGVEPGTIELAGDELDWDTCGACVRLIADAETDPKCYFATGGTLTVTSVEERAAGSLEDVTFQHVECENFAPPIDDGCSSSIGRLWFDDELVRILE